MIHRFRRARAAGGWTLVEVAVACTLLTLLGGLGLVHYSKAMEQSSLDLASTHLVSIWTAQRFYWLEKGRYAKNIKQLEREGLLDARADHLGRRYTFGIRRADEDSFTAYAKRIGSGRWSGRISIAEDGELIGGVKSRGGAYLEPTRL